MNNCKIITSSKCDLNVISGQLREKFSDRRHVVVVAELLITVKSIRSLNLIDQSVGISQLFILFIERLETIRHLIHHLLMRRRRIVALLLHTKVSNVRVVVDSTIHGIFEDIQSLEEGSSEGRREIND